MHILLTWIGSLAALAVLLPLSAGAQPFSPSLDLSTLNGASGFVLNGIDPEDVSGRSVSAAGDVNGDGIGDVIIGAFWEGALPCVRSLCIL